MISQRLSLSFSEVINKRNYYKIITKSSRVFLFVFEGGVGDHLPLFNCHEIFTVSFLH